MTCRGFFFFKSKDHRKKSVLRPFIYSVSFLLQYFKNFFFIFKKCSYSKKTGKGRQNVLRCKRKSNDAPHLKTNQIVESGGHS